MPHANSLANLKPLTSERARELASLPKTRLSPMRLCVALEGARRRWKGREGETLETSLVRHWLAVATDTAHPRWWEAFRELCKLDPGLQELLNAAAKEATAELAPRILISVDTGASSSEARVITVEAPQAVAPKQDSASDGAPVGG